MRVLGVGMLVLLGGCVSAEPVGVYRLAIQTGDQDVQLRTMLVRTENSDLVLWDAGAKQEFGRGEMQFAWDGTPEPFVLKKKPFPLTIYMRDGVIEDAIQRPWSTAPAQPLVASSDILTRYTLTANGDHTTFSTAGGTLWSETARTQPATTDVAPILSVLDSVAGTGLTLPANADSAGSWKDALSTAVPPDAKRPVPCAAPLVSIYRSYPAETVEVPAGKFQAVRITESIDSCLQRAPKDVLVYQVDRWFVPGLGPVKVRYQATDAKWREYLLVSTNVHTSQVALWPLAGGSSWTFEVHGPDGAVVDPGVEVKVSAAEDVTIQ